MSIKKICTKVDKHMTPKICFIR